ncbi:hypothetical protein KVR01_011939 [Diaporthe batatas]|uniref:uncharacterized protein n=1 Tax=Diaporthe batatas TaxID=748121 RepID=UPI001D05BDA8|nr:uncharacterized protein KVR01_011939 [Diaporthe batatas]KAG8158178.1 hypothetical protein KVR01_011939 [Diaporthe batatas]
MAESDLPLDIFNSRYLSRQSQSAPSPGADLEFPLFTQLPRELRLQIWTWHLVPRRRFLRVLLEEGEGAQHSLSGSGSEPGVVHRESEFGDDDEWTSSMFAGGPSEAETWPSAGPMAPLVRVTFLSAPPPEMPALRLVCREARDAHSSAYRIRLPALARIPRGNGTRDYTTTPIVALLNPELDILSLHTPNPRDIATLNLLPFFLHHLLQHDSSPEQLRFGARHICVDLKHLGSDHLDGRREDSPAPLPPSILASARLAVSHLRGLYLRLTTASHLEPRVTSGPFNNTRALTWYNASVPVLPAASWGFPGPVEPVPGGDPRLACPEGAADLRQVWVGEQLRPSLDVWAGLQRAWGVPAAAATRVRALVGLDAEGWAGRTLGGSSSLRAYLRDERATWQTLMDPALDMGELSHGFFRTALQRFLPGPPAVTPEEWISRREPHTAVGFWLVDPGVLEAAETTGNEGKRMVNLSGSGAEDIELWVFEGHS